MTLGAPPPASSVLPAVFTAAAMAAACSALSVFVVSRRWAFIGEGISHSGFGGAGTAWLLALAFPALDRPWVPYAGVVVFCLLTALAIGYVSRERQAAGRRVSTDTAIGIFMVASLAWGFLARQAYWSHHGGKDPAGWQTFLFGQTGGVSAGFAVMSVLLCGAVLATLVMLNKEIVYYCLDPAMAEAAGVRAGFVHYLLMLLVALTIIVGVRVVGSVLVTALLVLPGATALLLSSRLTAVVTASVAVGLAGAAIGLLANRLWPVLPTGPSMVLALFLQFCIAWTWGRARRLRPA